jgi:hypothetical protein
MNTLTTPIAVPQVTNLRVVRVAPDVDDQAIYLTVQARSGGLLPYPSVGTLYNLAVRDGAGLAQGLRATAAPTCFTDRVEVFSHPTAATAFTDLATAYAGAGGLAVKNKAVESAMIAAGLMPPGVVT